MDGKKIITWMFRLIGSYGILQVPNNFASNGHWQLKEALEGTVIGLILAVAYDF